MTVLELPVTLIGLLTPTEPVFPVVVTGSQRLLVITATDSDTLLPQLTEAGVRLRGAGAWVALPPTTTGLVLFQRWFTSPTKGQTRLPRATWAQQLLLPALRDIKVAR